MTQPKFAPILEQDEVRPGYQLGVPQAWVPHRPGESRPTPRREDLPGLGVRGPDQGYALELATMFRDRLVLEPGEHAEDVLAGAVAIALRRAAILGRAPIATDIALALDLFGYLSRGSDNLASRDLVAWRREKFAGAAHDYWRRRALSDAVPEETLRLSPAGVSERIEAEPDRWRELTGA